MPCPTTHQPIRQRRGPQLGWCVQHVRKERLISRRLSSPYCDNTPCALIRRFMKDGRNLFYDILGKAKGSKAYCIVDTRNPSGSKYREKTSTPAEPLADFSSTAADGYGTCVQFHIPRNLVKGLLSIRHGVARACASLFLLTSFVSVSWSFLSKTRSGPYED